METNADGEASFQFAPDTMAGTAFARIYTTDGAPIFDTLTATVTPGPLDTLQLGTDRLVMFLSQSVPVDDLLHLAADRFGNPVPASAMTVTTDGKMGVADATITATSEAVVIAHVGQGTVRADIQVAGLFDFRSTDWTVTFSCTNVLGNPDLPDSATFIFAADSVMYRNPLPSPGTLNSGFAMYLHGTEYDWQGGRATTRGAAPHTITATQFTDGLELPGNPEHRHPSFTPARQYLARKWCPSAYRQSGPAPMTATP